MDKLSIANNLFESIDILIEEKLKTLQFNRTLLMKVVDLPEFDEERLGRYQVEYQGKIYFARSALADSTSLEKEDMVWVLVLNNNINNEKIIIDVVDYYYKEKKGDNLNG